MVSEKRTFKCQALPVEKMQKMEIKIQQAAEGMIYIGMSIVFELQMQPLFNAIIVFWGDIYWDLFHLLLFCWETTAMFISTVVRVELPWEVCPENEMKAPSSEEKFVLISEC